MKRILILGASGKVGRMVVESIPESFSKGIEITKVFRGETIDENSVIWAPGQLMPRSLRADAVVALWGVTPGQGKNLEENAALAQDAISLATHVGADRVLHCSSAAVYEPELTYLSEDRMPNPGGAYGVAKVAMEKAVHAETTEETPVSVSMRIGNVAGADSLFASIKRGQDINLDQFPDGKGPERSYISPSDLGRVISALVLADLDELPKVVNVSAPVATEMEAIAREAGCVVNWQSAPETANKRVALDTTRLNNVIALGPEAADARWLVEDWKARDKNA